MWYTIPFKHTPLLLVELYSKNLNKTSQPRTVETLKKDYEAFVESGADKMKAKELRNVIHQSLVSSDSEKSFIFDLIPLNELHLMMGVVDHLIKFLGGKWQDLSI